jgi:hypothetical protein
MKIVVAGHRFDTDKAKKHYKLAYWDNRNWHTGHLWISSKGAFYMEEPTQWSNYAGNYRLTSPEEILENYRQYLESSEIEEISAYVEGWE